MYQSVGFSNTVILETFARSLELGEIQERDRQSLELAVANDETTELERDAIVRLFRAIERGWVSIRS